MDANFPEQELVQALRRRGLRLTPQRLAILAIIRSSSGHVTAEAIYRQVQQRFPGVNLTTIYRTLQWLHEQGLVHPFLVDFEQTRYEYHGASSHHHLVCRSCAAVIEIDDAALDALRGALKERYGFEAVPAHLAIPGRCAACAGAPDESDERRETHAALI
ncbi:MAG TPA: Fur family transcriptional regulator [Herpetosiphonaceae bacterium]